MKKSSAPFFERAQDSASLKASEMTRLLWLVALGEKGIDALLPHLEAAAAYDMLQQLPFRQPPFHVIYSINTHIQEQNRGRVAECVAVVHGQDRVVSVAIRLHAVDGRWKVAAMEW